MRQKFRPASKRKGLTLLEVILIIGFLGIVFFPVIQMFTRGLIASTEAENTLRAASLAEKIMEQKINMPWTNISSEAKTAIGGYPGWSEEIIASEILTNLISLEVRVYYPVGNSELVTSLDTMLVNF